MSFPVFAALPLNSLAIEEAEVQFSMTLDSQYKNKINSVTRMAKHRMQKKKDKFNERKRPWYVIDEPVDLTGKIGDESGSGATPEN